MKDKGVNLSLRFLAGAIDLLQFIFFIALLAFQFITPVGGGVAGAAAGAYFCYNASSGVVSGLIAGAKCAIGGTFVGAGISAFAVPIGMAIDVALSCTLGVLLLFLMWMNGRFYLMPVVMGFAGEMMPGVNAFAPGWSILVHRSIKRYNEEQRDAAENSEKTKPDFLSRGIRVATAVASVTTLAPALSVGARILPAEAITRKVLDRIPLQTRNFVDGIRRADREAKEDAKNTYAQAA